jgi:hypothetical protein
MRTSSARAGAESRLESTITVTANRIHAVP